MEDRRGVYKFAERKNKNKAKSNHKAKANLNEPEMESDLEIMESQNSRSFVDDITAAFSTYQRVISELFVTYKQDSKNRHEYFHQLSRDFAIFSTKLDQKVKQLSMIRSGSQRNCVLDIISIIELYCPHLIMNKDISDLSSKLAVAISLLLKNKIDFIKTSVLEQATIKDRARNSAERYKIMLSQQLDEKNRVCHLEKIITYLSQAEEALEIMFQLERELEQYKRDYMHITHELDNSITQLALYFNHLKRNSTNPSLFDPIKVYSFVNKCVEEIIHFNVRTADVFSFMPSNHNTASRLGINQDLNEQANTESFHSFSANLSQKRSLSPQSSAHLPTSSRSRVIESGAATRIYNKATNATKTNLVTSNDYGAYPVSNFLYEYNSAKESVDLCDIDAIEEKSLIVSMPKVRNRIIGARSKHSHSSMPSTSFSYVGPIQEPNLLISKGIQLCILYNPNCGEYAMPAVCMDQVKRFTDALDVCQSISDDFSINVELINSLYDDSPFSHTHETVSTYLQKIHNRKYMSHLNFLSNNRQSTHESVTSTLGLDLFAYMPEESKPLKLIAATASSTLACRAVQMIVENEKYNNKRLRIFCLTRPPGHHSGRDGLTNNAKSHGFCIYNHIAVACRYALTKYPTTITRIAIIDFDVFHGNGTEELFKNDSRIMYASFHAFSPNVFPGTGAHTNDVSSVTHPSMNGVQRGRKSRSRSRSSSDSLVQAPCMNFPFPPGYTYEKIQKALVSQVIPAIRNFKPDFILLSAGFGAHKDDATGLGGLEAHDFEDLSKKIVQVADEVCDGKVVSLLEGGYGPGMESYVEHMKLGIPLKIGPEVGEPHTEDEVQTLVEECITRPRIKPNFFDEECERATKAFQDSLRHHLLGLLH